MHRVHLEMVIRKRVAVRLDEVLGVWRELRARRGLGRGDVVGLTEIVHRYAVREERRRDARVRDLLDRLLGYRVDDHAVVGAAGVPELVGRDVDPVVIDPELVKVTKAGASRVVLVRGRDRPDPVAPQRVGAVAHRQKLGRWRRRGEDRSDELGEEPALGRGVVVATRIGEKVRRRLLKERVRRHRLRELFSLRVIERERVVDELADDSIAGAQTLVWRLQVDTAVRRSLLGAA